MKWPSFIRFLGRCLGSLVCAVTFGVAGIVTGLMFPWWDLEKPDK
jgi:hypothetical protein